MSRDRRQERKQETQAVPVDQLIAQEMNASAETAEPKQSRKLTDDQLAQLAHRLCLAYECAFASTPNMQPVADAIKQTASEVLKMGHSCDLRYVGELLRRLDAVIAPIAHRTHHNENTREQLAVAHDILSAAGVLS